MQVYRSLNTTPYLGNAIVTIGNFDGVHVGHVKILRSLVEEEQNGLESMVITFWPHPRKILPGSHRELHFLSSMEEKIDLLSKIGIKHLLILPFDQQLADMTAAAFVQEILVKAIGVKEIILGYDNRFGKNREGSLEFLQKVSEQSGFKVHEISRQEVERHAVSSSEIREHLLAGRLQEAALLLGRHYTLSGTVTEGKKLGRTIGFPTANIGLDFAEKLVPKNGVYAVKAWVDEIYYSGMMNIGFRPTVNGTSLSLEVHLFDFDQDIYGKTISVEFVKYIREEQKFASLEALKEQLANDKLSANTLLSHTNGF